MRGVDEAGMLREPAVEGRDEAVRRMYVVTENELETMKRLLKVARRRFHLGLAIDSCRRLGSNPGRPLSREVWTRLALRVLLENVIVDKGNHSELKVGWHLPDVGGLMTTQARRRCS